MQQQPAYGAAPPPQYPPYGAPQENYQTYPPTSGVAYPPPPNGDYAKQGYVAVPQPPPPGYYAQPTVVVSSDQPHHEHHHLHLIELKRIRGQRLFAVGLFLLLLGIGLSVGLSVASHGQFVYVSWLPIVGLCFVIYGAILWRQATHEAHHLLPH